MAINRLKSDYIITPPSISLGAQLSLASYALGANYEFISIGQAGTIAGAKYMVHRYDPGSAGTLTFSRGGYIDILLLAGGGHGGRSIWSVNVPTDKWTGVGGGGAGGLLLYYNQEVVANTNYAYSVGTAGAYLSYTSGGNTTFLGYTAIGGGIGAGNNQGINATSGGSGGGAAYTPGTGSGAGGSGTSGQGLAGGTTATQGMGGGGGGYVSVGATGGNGGTGGSGININFDGIDRAMAAGGGGGGSSSYGSGGLVDGMVVGSSSAYGALNAYAPFNGSSAIAPGCGGGGGGCAETNAYGTNGGPGTSGLLMIRYIVS